MDIDPVGWAGLATPIGCVLVLLLALARGWLVPGREVDRSERIWEARLKEAHEQILIWRKAAETSEETRRDVADQLRTRQIVDAAVVQAIAALPKAQERAGDGTA